MVERIYGVNVCSQLLRKISEDIKFAVNVKPLYTLMKVQNVIVREAFANLYLNNRWNTSDFENHAKFESRWRYPILMYHIELLEEYFRKQKYVGESFSEDVCSVILEAVGIDSVRINYFDFVKYPLKKNDMIEAEELYKTLWSRLYNKKHFSERMRTDFSPKLSTQTIREIFRDYLR